MRASFLGVLYIVRITKPFLCSSNVYAWHLHLESDKNESQIKIWASSCRIESGETEKDNHSLDCGSRYYSHDVILHQSNSGKRQAGRNKYHDAPVIVNLKKTAMRHKRSQIWLLHNRSESSFKSGLNGRKDCIVPLKSRSASLHLHSSFPGQSLSLACSMTSVLLMSKWLIMTPIIGQGPL